MVLLRFLDYVPEEPDGSEDLENFMYLCQPLTKSDSGGSGPELTTYSAATRSQKTGYAASRPSVGCSSPETSLGHPSSTLPRRQFDVRRVSGADLLMLRYSSGFHDIRMCPRRPRTSNSAIAAEHEVRGSSPLEAVAARVSCCELYGRSWRTGYLALGHCFRECMWCYESLNLAGTKTPPCAACLVESNYVGCSVSRPACPGKDLSFKSGKEMRLADILYTVDCTSRSRCVCW